MGKEVKIGLSVIAVLLCVFGGVLFVRLRGRNDATPMTKEGVAARKEAKTQGDKDKTSKNKGDNKLPGSRSASEPKFGGPSTLRINAPAKKEAPFASNRKAAEKSLNDGWSDSSDERLSSDAPSESEPAADRYGRRYDNESAPAFSAPGGDASSDDSSDMSIEESPAADPEVGEEPPLSAAPRLGGLGQPRDGYQVAEEPPAEEESTAMNLAESDPFPPASNATSPERNVFSERSATSSARGPFDAPLEPAPAEAALEPVADGRDEAIAENELQDRESAAGDYRSAPRASAFSPVSSRQPTAKLEADDSLPASLDRPDEAFVGGESAAGAMSGAYIVQPNDSFASISKKVYGTEAYFQALHEHNRERFPNPDLLNVGDEIDAPDVAALQKTYPQLCPKPRSAPSERRGGSMLLASSPERARGGRRYLVANGDTLFHIAKRELGKASRWKEIYELNQDQLGEDFNYLSPGMELRLPEEGGAKPDPVADRSRSGRLR